MIRFRSPLVVMAAAALVMATASAPGQTSASKAYLLNVSRKQTFTEIGSDDKTKPEFVEDFKELARQGPQGRVLQRAIPSATALPR